MSQIPTQVALNLYNKDNISYKNSCQLARNLLERAAKYSPEYSYKCFDDDYNFIATIKLNSDDFYNYACVDGNSGKVINVYREVSRGVYESCDDINTVSLD